MKIGLGMKCIIKIGTLYISVKKTRSVFTTLIQFCSIKLITLLLEPVVTIKDKHTKIRQA